ncbi:MAG: FtsQ-type POTRA domain-containing protein [Ruminococcus sp.]|nr:FtsQ-type POTRA domain-containing protein [Ruminococcus sp.]
MNDVEKTSIERNNSVRRTSRRKRKMSIYILAVILLVITVGITLCFTFMFNIDQIIISGESDTYTPMNIVEASGISIGDNLFRIDAAETEAKIHSELLNVEEVEVRKKFPASISIHVTRCIPTYNVEYQGGVLLVSERGKILANNTSQREGLAVVQGFEPKEMTVGKNISSLNEEKNDAFADMLENFGKYEDMKITEINMTDQTNIRLTYEDGILLKIGGCDDIEYKLDLASSVMNEPTVKGKKGLLRIIGSNECSFRVGVDSFEPEITVTTTTVKEDIPVTTTTTAAADDVQTPDDYTTPDYNQQPDYYYDPNYGYYDPNYGYYDPNYGYSDYDYADPNYGYYGNQDYQYQGW